jgi:hypothetical protein
LKPEKRRVYKIKLYSVISCGLPAGYTIFFRKNMVLWAICRCGLSDFFFAGFFQDKFCINFMHPILLYGYFILNILRHLASNQLNLVSNVAVYGHSFIQAIKTTKNCYDTVKFHA